MRAKKSLGQNFLMHRQTAQRIVAAATLPADATVLEIGPGTGMLTRALLEQAARVIAVETDGELIPELEKTFAAEIGEGSLELIHGDIRELNLETVPSPYHVVANIPYYITGELIRQLLTSRHAPESMTLLVQKEVAERIAREQKGSLLSLSVRVYGEPVYAFTVPRGAFKPAPKVDSAVLRIGNIGKGSFSSEAEEERFFEVLRAGFAHKRKRLAKNLEASWPSEAVRAAFDTAELSPHARAEDLSLETWLTLLHALETHR